MKQESAVDNNNDAPSVSVIIATRDRPKLLRRSIASVLAQEIEGHIEIIVVFDRSTPDLSLVEESEKYRVVVISNTRSPGLAGARNSGFEKASNEWIALCDDDDEWLPGKLSQQFIALEKKVGAKASCTGIYIHYEGKDSVRVPEESLLTFEQFLKDRMGAVHPSSWLVDKDTVRNEIGLVDEQIPGSYAEDYDFFLRTTQVTTIAVAPEPLVRVWWHGHSFFFERWKMIDDALEYLLNKYPEFAEEKAGSARIKGQQAIAKAAMGNRKQAFSKIIEAVKLNPLEKRLPVALLVIAGLPAEKVLKTAHRFGKGI